VIPITSRVYFWNFRIPWKFPFLIREKPTKSRRIPGQEE
jgi:hypothetical protein